MRKATIDRAVVEKILAHARRSFPLECCGLLSGHETHVTGIWESNNLAMSESAFAIPPAELFEFFRSLRAAKLDFTGIYHSHPHHPARPSERDAAEFHYREVSYWIVSLADKEPDLQCYGWGKMGFEELSYSVAERE